LVVDDTGGRLPRRQLHSLKMKLQFLDSLGAHVLLPVKGDDVVLKAALFAGIRMGHKGDLEVKVLYAEQRHLSGLTPFYVGGSQLFLDVPYEFLNV
jgi:hypothetical protein